MGRERCQKGANSTIRVTLTQSHYTQQLEYTDTTQKLKSFTKLRVQLWEGFPFGNTHQIGLIGLDRLLVDYILSRTPSSCTDSRSGDERAFVRSGHSVRTNELLIFPCRKSKMMMRMNKNNNGRIVAMRTKFMLDEFKQATNTMVKKNLK